MSLPSKAPSEHFEARLFAQWLAEQERQLKLTYIHVPNERADVATLGRLQQEGFRKGFPDYLIFTRDGRTLVLELKKARGGKLSAEQKRWTTRLSDYKVPCVVAAGHKAAIAAVSSFLNLLPGEFIRGT